MYQYFSLCGRFRDRMFLGFSCHRKEKNKQVSVVYCFFILVMKTNQFLLISISALLLALIFVDAWWTALLGQFLANVVLYPIALVFPTALKKVLLSSCTVGNGFSAIVYIGANFPSVWKVASDSFLSASTPSEHQFLPCPPGKN